MLYALSMASSASQHQSWLRFLRGDRRNGVRNQVNLPSQARDPQRKASSEGDGSLQVQSPGSLLEPASDNLSW